ncbi:MAG: TonB-dependent receptor [Acidobacteria bacterium]|nr:TonB-dependent receptor [Acidobacteriota bacterium]
MNLKKVASLLFLASVASVLPAQVFRGSIAGTVTDPTGAAIAGAPVEVSNTGTGLKRSTVTSNSGEFTVPDLPLGEYSVTISQPGFDIQKIQALRVEVGKIASLDIKLKIASQTQAIEVAAAAVTLDTDTATLNQVIPDKAVQEVPLNGRDFTQLVKLAPGVNGAGSLNGARTMQNNWQIDGADNNDLWHNSAAVNQGGVSGVAGTLLPIDAIDQFSVQSHANAESGRNAGGSINMVIKSGTNSLHGSVYYFNRNDALAENTPFAPAGTPKPKLKNNQFGASVGGPVIKDKLFYFVTYERQKLIVGNGNSSTEPSSAWVTQAQGVLAKYGIAVNPVSTNLLSFWPSRARSGGAVSPNFFGNDISDNYSDNGIAKIDYVINAKNNLSARWFVGTGAQTAPVGSPLHEYYQVAPSRMQNYSVVYNTVFSPTMANQLLAGVNYFKQTFNDFDTSANPVAAGLNTGVTNPSLGGSPDIAISGFDEIGLTPPLGRIDTTGHLNETLSITKSAHQLRFGGEYRRARADVFYMRNQRGTFSFDGTQGPWANDASVSNNLKSLADFLGGYVSSSTIVRGDLQRNYYMNAFSMFAQDTWRLTRRLSLDYGARWEYFGPISDPTNRISTFLPNKGGIVYTGSNGLDSLYPKRWNNIAPRIGFAYSPVSGGKFVVRGNYGIYYDSPAVNAFGDNRPPNSGATGILSNPGSKAPVYSLTRSNYQIASGQAIFGDANIPSPPYGAFSVDQGFKNASSQNFGLNLQYQVNTAVVAELGYVGSVAHHLLTVLDINQPLNSTLGTAAIRSVQNTTRPYYSTFPTLATINQVGSAANSHYQGMVASLRTNNWHGVTSQFGYTVGHAIDDASAVRGATPMNSYNLKQDYGNSDFDIRHTFTTYITYQIPALEHGPKLLVRGWQLNTLISAYSGRPFSVTAGKNFSGTFEGRDRVVQVSDPYQGGSSSIVTTSSGSKYVQWLNPAAFVNPTSGTFGTLGRNTLRGPGFFTTDFAIMKETPITERIRSQFRVEMFNLFNRTNLPNPTGSLSSGSFGRIGDTIGDANGATGIGAGEPFNVQLALKLVF